MLSPLHRRRLLAHRHHLAAPARDSLAATRALLALHSTDPCTPYLSLRARVAGFQNDELERALLGDRSLWRLHSMRRTLFVVPARDGARFQGAAGWEVARAERKRLVQWLSGLDGPNWDARWLAGVEADTLELLSGGQERKTQELSRLIPALETRIVVGSGKWSGTVPLSSRLLFLLAMEGKLVRTRAAGSWRSSQYLWAGAEGWFGDAIPAQIRIPNGAAQPVEAGARAELVRAYLASFGPATLEDVRWWTGWTKGKTMEALAACDTVSVPLEEGGEGLILREDRDALFTLAETPVPEGTVNFLPALDPTPMGWKERAWYLGGHTTFGGPLFDRNGNVGPTVWLDGRVVGGWAQRPDGEVVWRLLEPVGSDAEGRLRAEAEGLAAWLDGEVVTPRFPTPLQRELAG